MISKSIIIFHIITFHVVYCGEIDVKIGKSIFPAFSKNPEKKTDFGFEQEGFSMKIAKKMRQ